MNIFCTVSNSPTVAQVGRELWDTKELRLINKEWEICGRGCSCIPVPSSETLFLSFIIFVCVGGALRY